MVFSSHNVKLKDLSVQSVNCVVNPWTERMYNKFGQLTIWPHSDIIINQMPKKYKTYFPTSLVLLMVLNYKPSVRCALALQSQLYSDYKSSTTLKCLDHWLLFVSELFTG